MASVKGMASAEKSDNALLDEVKYLHQCMFRREPSDKLASAYLAAHLVISDLENADPRQVKTVNTIVNLGLNPNGIEPWLREKRKRHLLSAKMLLIAYLAECDTNHPEFARNAGSKHLAFFIMAGSVLKAVGSLLTGYVQKKRYGLV